MLIHGTYTRDETVLLAVNGALRQALQGRSGAGSPGVTHTVTCFDEAPLATPELLQQTRKAYSPVLTDEGVFNGPEGCDALHPYRGDPDQLAAVKSDIPTLIITGEFDFQTHRSNGPLVANRRLVPGAGAGQKLDGAFRLAAGLVARPGGHRAILVVDGGQDVYARAAARPNGRAS